MADQPTSSTASEPSAAGFGHPNPPSTSNNEYTNSRDKVPLPGENPKPSYRGPNSSFVRLDSSDGHEFFLRRRYAFVAPTVRSMLAAPMAYGENEAMSLNCRDIKSHTLRRTVQYFIYFYRYDECWFEIPPFPVSPDESVDLMLAASFFKC